MTRERHAELIARLESYGVDEIHDLALELALSDREAFHAVLQHYEAVVRHALRVYAIIAASAYGPRPPDRLRQLWNNVSGTAAADALTLLDRGAAVYCKIP